MPIKYRIKNTPKYVQLQILGDGNVWLNGQAGVRYENEYFDVVPLNQYFGGHGIDYSQWGMIGHNGIDFNTPNGGNLYAMCSGVVISMVDASKDTGYGQNIDILTDEIRVGDNKYRFEVIYGHLKNEFVSLNQRVNKGDLIGICDNTGYPKASTGPHLHVGFRLLEPISQLGNNYSTHWYLSGWGYKNNGYLGYVNYLDLIDNYIVMNKALEQYEGKYIQMTEAPGGLWKVVNGEMKLMSTIQDPVTRHFEIVDEAIGVLKKYNLIVGKSKSDIEKLL